MALFINTNTAALTAQANLAQSSQRVSTSISRLSSGRRNITSGDDAAGLQLRDAAQAAGDKVASELKPQGQEAKDTVTLTQRNTRESAAVEQKQIDATQAVKSRQDAD
jgi:hypothetical protein